MEEKVRIVDLQIKRAWDNVSLLKPAHISEVKVLSNPSEFIRTVLKALVILIHEGPLVKEIKDKDGHMIVE